MSNSNIFVWALAVYVVAVFVAAFALLRMRRENQSLREQVRKLEEARRSRQGGRDDGDGATYPGGSPVGGGDGRHE